MEFDTGDVRGVTRRQPLKFRAPVKVDLLVNTDLHWFAEELYYLANGCNERFPHTLRQWVLNQNPRQNERWNRKAAESSDL